MSSLKSQLFALCHEVASEFDGWSFSGREFRNKNLRHTTLFLSTGFYFHGGANPDTDIKPFIFLVNKRVNSLSENIIGRDCAVSSMDFQQVWKSLSYYPTTMVSSLGKIWLYKQEIIDRHRQHIRWPETWITIDQAKPVLKAMMSDGVKMFEEYYDLSSERSFLRNLPPKYEPFGRGAYEEMEGIKGVTMCLVRILLGDFDFFEHYCTDFKTEKPKRVADLEKIAAALPQLKEIYATTGFGLT